MVINLKNGNIIYVLLVHVELQRAVSNSTDTVHSEHHRHILRK